MLVLASAIIVCLCLAILLLFRQVKILSLPRFTTPIALRETGFELLEHFPQPIIIANGQGTILYANPCWKHLPAGVANVTSLAEFDRLTGTKLNGRLVHSVGQRNFVIRLQSADTNVTPHLFSAVAWPLTMPAAANSIALALFPQEQADARNQEYPRLERELLVYSRRSVGLALSSLQTNDPQKSRKQLTELSEVLSYIHSHHTKVRSTSLSQPVDIAAVWRTTLTHLRPHIRPLGLHISSNISRDSMALGQTADLELLFTILLEYICDGTGNTSITLYQRQHLEHHTLEIETNRIANLTSLQAFRLRLITQLAVKQGGTFEHIGPPHPRYRLQLRAAKQAK